LDNDETELDEKTKSKLLEIKDILFDVIEDIDEAIGYESEKEKEEENKLINYIIYHLYNNLLLEK
jgi:hypothetical protein